MKCAVNKCENENNSKACKISFFNFPLHTDLLNQWILFCDRKGKFNVKTSHVCMDHFKPEDFENNLQYEMGFTKRRFLKSGAVPSIRKGYDKNEGLYEERATRIQNRENKEIVEMLLKEEDAEPVCNDIKSPTVQMETEVLIEWLEKDREHLFKENCVLKQSLKKLEEQLKASEEKRKKDSKMYEFKIVVLKTKLTKAHFVLNKLKKKLLAVCYKMQN